MGAYKYIKRTLQQEYAKNKDQNYDYKAIYQQKLIQWRREPLAVVPIERPSNPIRARSLGFKAKDGVYLFRVRIRRGSGTHTRPNKGRKPKKMGTNKLTRAKSIQWIAEERVASRVPFLEVLNSYFVGEDGQHKFFEVITIDPFDPAIVKDKNKKWLLASNHTGRVFRGLTSAGRASRGLHKKGKGSEYNRPSVRSNNRKAR